MEEHGWDGAWYRRAYDDAGLPLGSSASEECRIDSIAQSWSVICGGGRPERRLQAMRSLEEHLVDREARLARLLTPPFDKGPQDPGYIKGYLPGVRENGAQYTHAAVWAVLARAIAGDGEGALELFQMINPLTHARTAAEVATYKVEPYVVAADVYTAEGQRGRGGWTWYTGSASWMYRVGLEAILGFTRRGDSLQLLALCSGRVERLRHRLPLRREPLLTSRRARGRPAGHHARRPQPRGERDSPGGRWPSAHRGVPSPTHDGPTRVSPGTGGRASATPRTAPS